MAKKSKNFVQTWLSFEFDPEAQLKLQTRKSQIETEAKATDALLLEKNRASLAAVGDRIAGLEKLKLGLDPTLSPECITHLNDLQVRLKNS